ncbi:PREDICTED: uncharacterized protein LOC105144045 isoform X1 [Acromyrmex echinatior]|uniref:Uncharacterized protein n=1 Tax=Acromyrmex echinatior TaxID=103372 RepID=F4WDW0_ACREC|nr:PREDICTED: uncharacterized protein LOC105144045 isoform X1 [Acromyrmex echinatior]EGI67592.1 hypothetical protein G5I_03785 [Acromyrmex echinatior]
MAASDLPCSSPFVLAVMLFVATLTSSINAAIVGTSLEPSIPGHDSLGSLTEPLSLTVEPPNATGDKKALVLYSSVAEGGPIITLQRGSTTTESNKPDEARARESAPKERHATPSVVARKGVDKKIKPRKGVTNIPEIITTKDIDQNIDPEKKNVLLNQTFENMKLMSSPAIETAHIKSETSNVSLPKLNTTNPRSYDNLNHRINSNYSNISLPANGTAAHLDINNTTKTSLHVEKHIPKPKPTVTTVDGPEINESIPLLRTKNPPLGMPRKIDYIVPVIITIVALPILGAAIFVLYRRGRDCWDKRHYRRMDFLIDGMYND